MENPSTGAGRKPGSAKTGGRQKGTPNKSTAQRRELINKLNDMLLEDITKSVASMTLQEKIALYKITIGYSTGKVVAVDPDAEEKKEKDKSMDFILNLDPPATPEKDEEEEYEEEEEETDGHNEPHKEEPEPEPEEYDPRDPD